MLDELDNSDVTSYIWLLQLIKLGLCKDEVNFLIVVQNKQCLKVKAPQVHYKFTSKSSRVNNFFCRIK